MEPPTMPIRRAGRASDTSGPVVGHVGDRADTDVRVDAGALEGFCASALVDAGCGHEDAAAAARSIVVADLRGVHTHGVRRLGGYVTALQRGALKPRPALTVVRETS